MKAAYRIVLSPSGRGNALRPLRTSSTWLRTILLVMAFVSLVPEDALAQSSIDGPASSDSSPTAPAPVSDCTWRRKARQARDEATRQLTRVDHARGQFPLKGAVITLAISSGIVVAGVLAASLGHDSEYQSIPALWAIPGAGAVGVLASGVLLGVRVNERRPFNLERAHLLRQMAHLDFLLANRTCEEGIDVAAMDRAARARVLAIDHELGAIHARAEEISLAGPIVLLGAGGAVTASMLVAGVLLLVNVADAEDHGEPAHRTPMRATFGSAVVGAGMLIGGGVWFRLRMRDRKAVLREKRPLQKERRLLEPQIVPQLGPTGVGLSLSLRF